MKPLITNLGPYKKVTYVFPKFQMVKKYDNGDEAYVYRPCLFCWTYIEVSRDGRVLRNGTCLLRSRAVNRVLGS